jgi:hypothetical protein
MACFKRLRGRDPAQEYGPSHRAAQASLEATIAIRAFSAGTPVNEGAAGATLGFAMFFANRPRCLGASETRRDARESTEPCSLETQGTSPAHPSGNRHGNPTVNTVKYKANTFSVTITNDAQYIETLKSKRQVSL